MYEDFFGVREAPFENTPDTRYLVLTPRAEEIVEELTYGVEARKGLLLLTGEVGTGKTTLLSGLIDRLRRKETPVAFIQTTLLDVGCFYETVLAEFGVKSDATTTANPTLALRNWVSKNHDIGKNPVLIIDEAQRLSVDVFDEIRMLLNLETPQEKKLQIVLAGQQELLQIFRRPRLYGLKQRVALRSKTMPLYSDETRDYIQERLRIAGSARPEDVFSREATTAIHSYSCGIPRIINLLCEQALVNAYADGIRPVPAHVVEKAGQECGLERAHTLRPFPYVGREMWGKNDLKMSGTKVPRPFEASKNTGVIAPDDRGAPALLRVLSYPVNETANEERPESDLITGAMKLGRGICPEAIRGLASVDSHSTYLLPRKIRERTNPSDAAICILAWFAAWLGVNGGSWTTLLVTSFRWLQKPIEPVRALRSLWSVWQANAVALSHWLQEPVNPFRWLIGSLESRYASGTRRT